MTIDAHLLAVARAARGFMPDDEGLALHDAGLAGAAAGHALRSSGIQPSHGKAHSCTITPNRFSTRLKPATQDRSSLDNVK